MRKKPQRNPKFDKFSRKVSDSIRAARKSKGLTQLALGELSGIGEKHISGIERGYHDNSELETLFELAEALGYELEIRFSNSSTFGKISESEEPEK